jgi:hypothetical protein
MNNLLTASRMSALLQCPRKHYWRYEVGLASESESIALRFGSAWHRAMEARWNGADYESALTAALGNCTDLDEVSVATLSGLLAGYFAHYADESFIKTVYAETQFDQPIPGSRTFQAAGKIDGLCELHDGRLALKEDKTTSDNIAPDSDYWLRLRFNSQLLQYVIAARGMGWDVSTIIYDVVRKPAIEPKQIAELDENGKKIVVDADGNRVFKKDGTPRESGDTAKGYTLKTRVETPEEFSTRLVADTQARPDFYFARREVPIIEQDLAEFEAQRLTLSRMILHCRSAQKKLARPDQAWPRNVDKINCAGCSFNSFCLQNLNIDPNNPPNGFKVGVFNPELASDAK